MLILWWFVSSHFLYGLFGSEFVAFEIFIGGVGVVSDAISPLRLVVLFDKPLLWILLSDDITSPTANSASFLGFHLPLLTYVYAL